MDLSWVKSKPCKNSQGGMRLEFCGQENIPSLQELKWEGFETERSKIVQEQAKKSTYKKHRGQGKRGWVGGNH